MCSSSGLNPLSLLYFSSSRIPPKMRFMSATTIKGIFVNFSGGLKLLHIVYIR